MSAPQAAPRAWRHAGPDGRRFTIRPATTLDELELCIELQQKTWGYSDLEVVPRNIYVLAQAVGGHVLCAWDEQGAFSGFAMAVAAHEPHPGTPGAAGWMQPLGSVAEASAGEQGSPPPTPYLHSHLVAVAAGAQSCGLGFALKFAQRDLALASGIATMRWTFDPLMAGNAAFNLGKLGAVVRRYLPDFYGRLGSVLQGNTPTDRLLAEWVLRSDRVNAAHGARLTAMPAPAVEIVLPAEVAVWKRGGMVAHVEAVQRELRQSFTEAFMQGFVISGFVRDADGGGRYLLHTPSALAPQLHYDPK